MSPRDFRTIGCLSEYQYTESDRREHEILNHSFCFINVKDYIFFFQIFVNVSQQQIPLCKTFEMVMQVASQNDLFKTNKTVTNDKQQQ